MGPPQPSKDSSKKGHVLSLPRLGKRMGVTGVEKKDDVVGAADSFSPAGSSCSASVHSVSSCMCDACGWAPVVPLSPCEGKSARAVK